METIIVYSIYITIAAFAILVVADYATRSETSAIAPATEEIPDTVAVDKQPAIELSESLALPQMDEIALQAPETDALTENAIASDEPIHTDELTENAIEPEVEPDKTDEPKPDNRPSFHRMTVRQQRRYAKQNGIQIPRHIRKKADISEYLRFVA